MSSRKTVNLIVGLLFTLLLSTVFLNCKGGETTVSANPVAPPAGSVYITVTAPKNGDTLKVGSSFTIQWASNTASKVKIQYSTDFGANWLTIADSIANNGTYVWFPIPNLVTTEGKISITTVDKLATNINSGIFSVNFTGGTNSQLIKILTPNGGESWPGNTSQTINWYSSSVDSVKIEYTTDDGNNWNIITSRTPSTGTFLWNPLPNTPSNNAKVRISDASDGTPSVISDGVFSIAPEPPLNITVPSGGENWVTGTSQRIHWDFLGKLKPQGNQIQPFLKSSPYHVETIAFVKIEYTTNAGSTWFPIVASTPNIGYYDWNPIPSQNSELCQIRISDADLGVPFTISKDFTITNQIVQSLTITSPAGGEIWDAGTNHNITWNPNAVNSVKIEFFNGVSWSTIVDRVDSVTSYPWTLPVINSALCKIRISDAIDGNPIYTGNAFTIRPIASISVTAPNAGDVFVAGDPVNIKWTSSGIDNVKIEYTNDNGVLDLDWHTLVASTPSNGSFVTSFSIPTNQYRIRISEALTGSPMAYSNGVFTISPQPVRTVTVTSPNGGENWLIPDPSFPNETNEIRWTSTNVDSVKIEYTLDGGANWNSIIDRTPSNGLYNWTIPKTAVRSDLCLIRVSDTKLGTPSDISDGFFSIHPNTKLLRLIFPNGGNLINTDTSITWVSAGITAVNIEYTIDNGMSWNTIVNNTHSTGAYTWIIPPDISTLARIRISDASDNNYSDMSDSYFNLNVSEPLLKIIQPSNKIFSMGSDMNISWSGNNKVSSVRIEYWSDNTRSWNPIADNVTSTYKKANNYLWKGIPKSKGNILIRIVDSNGKYSDKSETLTIK